MSELELYKGLQILTPEPSEAGGLAIQNNFKTIIDRVGAPGTAPVYPNASFGTSPDLLSINDGVIGLAGGTKRLLDLRPEINIDEINKAGVPTAEHVGVFYGYSMPIWNNDNEELHFRQHVPGRWDGISDIVATMYCCLASAETIGETFRFQMSWNRATVGAPLSIASIDVETEVVVLDGTQYSYFSIPFALEWDTPDPDLQSHDLLGMRLRRITSSGDEVDGEIIVLCWHLTYVVDKMFRAP